MKALSKIALAAFGLSMSGLATAQMHDHGHAAPAVKSSSTASAPMSDGLVQKIDRASNKITLKHGDLKNLGMGPMTMGFLVKDAAIFDKVAVGDKVRFVAELDGGKLAVTKLEVMK